MVYIYFGFLTTLYLLFDLNFQGYWYHYYGSKFIPYRYSFIEQMTKQSVKAPGPLVDVEMTRRSR